MAEPTAQGLYPLFTTQFSTLLELKLQQMGSLLRGMVREGVHVGKMASPVQQLNATMARQPSGRYGTLNIDDNGFTRRWVFPTMREKAQLIDTFDMLQTIVDPQGPYAENAAQAFGRAMDDILFQGAFGANQTGDDAASLSVENFNTALTTAATPGWQVGIQVGGGGANVGMNVAKLVEAQRTFLHNHVDLDRDPATLVIGSQQHADLLGLTQVTSAEYAGPRPVLLEGRVKQFMGMNVVVSERLPYTSSQRNCLCFVKSGLYLGVWRDLQSNIDIRHDISGRPFQLYSQMMIGATRLEPFRVLQITCADTTGGDTTP